MMRNLLRIFVIFALVAGISGCGLRNDTTQSELARAPADPEGTSIFDLFGNSQDPNVTINVNKYIWNAALDVLDMLPLESADPFSGVIVTGWGSVSGTAARFRATVFVQGPALDARSLRVAVYRQTGGAPVPSSDETVLALENAILTRARQLRIADAR